MIVPPPLRRLIGAGLLAALPACSAPYGLSGVDDFTPDEQADIYSAIASWENATPAWREAQKGPIHFERVDAPYVPDHGTFIGYTRSATILAPTCIVQLTAREYHAEVWRTMVIHELGHCASLEHREDVASVMRAKVQDDAPEPTAADVASIAAP